MADPDLTLLTAWVDHRDAEAMATIVRRHSSMVYTTCLRVLGNDADARDVAQECFIKLAGVETVGASLSGLLHTMATHQSLNRIRSEGRRRAREQAYAESREDTIEATWDDVQLFVDEAIAELPEKARVAIVRHFFEGETHEAIARDEGLTRAAVSHRIERGIATVRSLLEERGVPIGGTALAATLAAHGAQAAPAAFTAGLTKLAIAGAKSTSAAGTGVSAAAGTATGAGILGGMTVTKIAALAAIVIGVPTVGLMTMTRGAMEPPDGQALKQDFTLEALMHITGVVVSNRDGRPVPTGTVGTRQ